MVDSVRVDILLATNSGVAEVADGSGRSAVGEKSTIEALDVDGRDPDGPGAEAHDAAADCCCS